MKPEDSQGGKSVDKEATSIAGDSDHQKVGKKKYKDQVKTAFKKVQAKVSAVKLLPAPSLWDRIVIYKKKYAAYFLMAVFVFITIVLAVVFKPYTALVPQSNTWLDTDSRQYSQTYSFVREKVSKSAPIMLDLPTGVESTGVQDSVSFDPPIEGSWLETNNENQLMYQPAEALEVGKYYAVRLDTGELQLSSDFLVEENPEVIAVFPSEDSESHENNSITIMFNRPMVPLTTLSKQEEKSTPVFIHPETEGRFKWISSRNLQFIPTERLVRSSKYRVTIGEGMTSMDGLTVAGLSHEFVTRPLRHKHTSNGRLGYSQPVKISFNQSVDLERTRPEFEVSGGPNQSTVPIVVEYGIRSVYNQKTGEHEDMIDRSTLYVYQQEDVHGRELLWDFDSKYTIRMKKAFPLEGDILLESGAVSSFYIPEIITDVRASSERSDNVTVGLFDPQGELHVKFAEEIDIDKSKIKAKGLGEVTYQEVCDRDESGYIKYETPGGECVKKPNYESVVLTFNADSFNLAEKVEVEFDKIYNREGLKLNPDPLYRSFTTYPELRISKVIPQNDSRGASLTELYICSNSPLRIRDRETYGDYIKADQRLVFSRWGKSYLVKNYSRYGKCAVGEFQTEIRYGLLPETIYNLSLQIEDDFDQVASKKTKFTTRSADGYIFRFHNLQKQYNVATSDRTKLLFAVENMEYMNLHICKLSPDSFLNRIHNRPSSDAPPSTNCDESKSDKIKLPSRYWVNNYFHVNIADYFKETLGHYVLTFSHPNLTYYYSKKERYERVYLSVTNIAVGAKTMNWSGAGSTNRDLDGDMVEEDNSDLYWVNNALTLEPLAGASVTTYKQTGSYQNLSYINTAIADDEGVALVPVSRSNVGAVVRYQKDSAIVSKWADKLEYTTSARETGKTYLYTDRPIYRPGQEVHMRGLDRIGFDGSYEIATGQQPEVVVRDSGGEEVFKQTVNLTPYGTFSASFELPEDAPLGTYYLKAFGATSYFSVEEYVPAAFKLELSTKQDEYVAGDTMEVTINADYYFGVPLDGGSINYTVTSQDYYFDRYTDEYFLFGRGWYYCYHCGYGDDFLFRGRSEINETGQAAISHQLDFASLYKDPDDEGSKIFVLHVTATDSNGRSVSAKKSFIVHRGEIYLGVKPERRYAPDGTEIPIKLKTVDTEGNEISHNDIEILINRIDWKSYKRQEVDGGYYYRSEKQLTLMDRKVVSTNRKGDHTEKFTFEESGSYEVTAKTTDSNQNVIKSQANIYIYGGGGVSVRPTNNHDLDIESDNTNVAVGDTGSILIQSPFERSKALITVERGGVFDYWVKDIRQSLFNHDFLIKDEYIPNVYVSTLLLSPDPEIKYGQQEFRVDTDRREINVEVNSNKKNYLPGEEVTLEVRTTDNEGEPLAAEVSVAVADLSVLALKGNPKKNPLVFFYQGFPLTVSTLSNVKNILHEQDIPLGTKGGGGGDPEDLAKKKRGEFKDTAYWSAHVETNAAGVATVSFTLPDNLTTWQVETLGITKDTRLGVDYQELLSRKDLMVLPIKPRFIVPGDKFSLGAKIFNQTESKIKVDVMISSDSLALSGDADHKLSLAAGETATVFFDAEAPAQNSQGLHKFTIGAKNSDFEDVVEHVIPITRNETYETVATAHFTKTDKASEYVHIPNEVIPDQGGLTINTNATLAVFLSGALNYLVNYPYGCSEQLSSKLGSIAIVKRGLDLKNVGDKFKLDDITFGGRVYTMDEVVDLGLSRIYQSQSSGGGFSYYSYLEPSFYLSLHVVDTLKKLKLAGYEVNETVLNKAYNYIYNELSYGGTYTYGVNRTILAAHALHDSSISQNRKDVVEKKLVSEVSDDSLINEGLSSTALAHLSLMITNGFGAALGEGVWEALENRIDIDGRGAYLKSSDTRLYRFYETPIKNTALLLKVISAREEEHPLNDKILRWLLKSRYKDGAWGSTHNTLQVVDAMTDYLSWQRETESDFELDVQLNDESIMTADFNADTILNTVTKEIPINEFAVDTTERLDFIRTNRNSLQNNFYYDMSLKYFLPANQIPPRDEGMTVSRALYQVADVDHERPLAAATVGDVVKGRLTITVPKQYQFVAVEDFIPAGFEIVNFDLNTESKQSVIDYSGGKGMRGTENKYATRDKEIGFIDRSVSRVKSWFGGGTNQSAQAGRNMSELGYVDEYKPADRLLRASHKELHDDRVFLFIESLSPGVYVYEYYLRALVPGEFNYLPAVASEMYFPEVFGRTEGNYFTVTKD